MYVLEIKPQRNDWITITWSNDWDFLRALVEARYSSFVWRIRSTGRCATCAD